MYWFTVVLMNLSMLELSLDMKETQIFHFVTKYRN